MSFVNLHAHSHYSLLDGFGSPKDIISRCKELGYPAAALTDHGCTYGLVEFYEAARKEGIKPILGCEIYVAPRTRFDKEAKIDNRPYHLTLLAKNNTGYQNLLKLVSKANLEGFYYKPRVDYGLLKAYGDGLIALSGCIMGNLPRAILSEDEEEILKVIEKHIDIFGKENYYLEIQDRPLMEAQNIVNAKMKELSKKHKIPLVATNDSHYPRPEDSDVHDLMLCIQTGTTVSDENRMRYIGDFSIRSREDLAQAFSDVPEAIENTVKIADRCNVEIEFGNNLIPSFKTPNHEDPHSYLRKLCEEGLARRFNDKDIPKEYAERLNYELMTVNKMGFDSYFLIVSDFVRYAKSQDIVVGPGRGSAAGSIIAWSLNITDLDPIQYGLFFERFLNPERISMPDIDIDFADHRRDEVLNYVIEKYGRDNVAQIITFGTMASRAAVRDVGRALGYPYSEVDALAKTVPPPVLGKNIPLIIATKEDPDLRNAYENNERAKTLLNYAMRLDGTVRHIGTHACAVVISEKPLTEYTALQHGARGDENEIVTQYSAKPLESLGLLKMDFLGLKNLTVIEHTVKILKRTREIDVDINTIPLDDKKVFKMLQKGDSTGVFQLESAGMKRYLKQLKPTEFEDIVAMGALYRPGPMEWIPNYIKGKHEPDKVSYLHPSFKDVLHLTYGVAVYQEQILQIARDFAGFTLGEADILRKAVGKKSSTLLKEQRKKFVDGATKNGHKEKFAIEVFEEVIEPFAGYGFNRAHAVCYGMIAYQTAYLKAKYPVEFMTALLCSDANNTDRVVLEIKECSEMGIDILPPSINESFSRFTVVGDNKIRFGLLAIKGVGEGPIKELIDVRDKTGPFKSLEDFAKRVPVKILNKKLIQAMSYAGAFDDFGDRRQIAENYEEISNFAKQMQSAANDDQTDIFGMMEPQEHGDMKLRLKKVESTSDLQKLKWEREFLGMYVSSHPLRGLRKYIAKKGNLIGDLNEQNIGRTVKVVGLISNLKKILTKSGTYMATFLIEDPTAMINATMFPKDLAKYGDALSENSVLGFSGRLNYRRDQYQVSCEVAKNLSIDNMIMNAKELNAFDENDKTGGAIRMLDDILAEKKELADLEKQNEVKIEDFDVTPEKEEEDDIFVIEVPKDTPSEKMEQIKLLLERNKGKTPVVIHLNHSKKLKTDFKVNVTKDLKDGIFALLS
jgi:DNA polymerase-3 subunit alpha